MELFESMRIACVDNSPIEREQIIRYLEEAFSSQRGAVGHLPDAAISSCSLEELMFVAHPGTIIIGPGFEIEQTFEACRKICEHFPDSPVILIFAPANYSLRVLRRFERFTKALFCWEEPSTRLVHTLLELENSPPSRKRGRLLVVSGVKGGIGATSYVAGLAHAGQSLGHTAVLVDLSASGALIHYMGAARRHSGEYSTILSERLRPQREIIDRLLVSAPNGTTLLLPPSGSKEIREMWLRDASRFEFSLILFEFLLEMFDLVIVDRAGAEGILPFALNSQADIRLLLTTNDPASVYLLQRELCELAEIPGDAETCVAVNLLLNEGLTDKDVFEFAVINEPALRPVIHLPMLPSDHRARHWIGTGNTLYTEGCRQTQAVLETHARTFLSKQPLAAVKPVTVEGVSSPSASHTFTQFIEKIHRKLPRRSSTRLLPAPSNLLLSEDPNSNISIMRPRLSARKAFVGESPSEHLDEHGSLTLEQVLFFSGAIALACVAIPDILSNFAEYLNQFVDGGSL